MKIDIYVDNCTGIVVPAGTDISMLPLVVAAQAKSASCIRHDVDLNDSCIGLNRDAALAGLKQNGYYVNIVKIIIGEKVA